MSNFLKDLEDFLTKQPFKIIRASEIYDNNEPETIEQIPGNPCQNSYSIAKTFTMTAIGLLYDRGKVKLNDKVCDILSDELPEYGMDPRWYDSTVEMALKHSLGLPSGFLDIDTHKSTEFGRNYLDYMLKYPLEYTPGEDSRYSDGAYYLLSVIVEKISGKALENYLWEELLYDLGFLEFAFSHCPMGHAMGATGMYTRSEDIAKLGQLYLNNGVYKGKRLLSEDWTNTAVEREFAFDWDEEHKVYCKGGMCGQKLIVAPSQKRVVCVHSFGGNTGIIEKFIRDYQ